MEMEARVTSKRGSSAACAGVFAYGTNTEGENRRTSLRMTAQRQRQRERQAQRRPPGNRGAAYIQERFLGCVRRRVRIWREHGRQNRRTSLRMTAQRQRQRQMQMRAEKPQV